VAPCSRTGCPSDAPRALGGLAERLFEEGHELYTCGVVTCETLSRGDDSELRHVRALLEALEYVATSPSAAAWAGESRRNRHAESGKRGLGDALLAGLAREIGATVVTRNRPDFERQGVPVLNY
jgi:predicted nucleic acid-binding protein